VDVDLEDALDIGRAVGPRDGPGQVVQARAYWTVGGRERGRGEDNVEGGERFMSGVYWFGGKGGVKHSNSSAFACPTARIHSREERKTSFRAAATETASQLLADAHMQRQDIRSVPSITCQATPTLPMLEPTHPPGRDPRFLVPGALVQLLPNA